MSTDKRAQFGFELPCGAWAIVREKSIQPDNRHGLFLLVEYWPSRAACEAGEPFARRNDFLFGVLDSAQFDPGHLGPLIVATLDGYWRRAEEAGHPRDHSDPSLARGDHDPHGYLANPHVQALEVAE